MLDIASIMNRSDRSVVCHRLVARSRQILLQPGYYLLVEVSVVTVT